MRFRLNIGVVKVEDVSLFTINCDCGYTLHTTELHIALERVKEHVLAHRKEGDNENLT